MPSRAARLRALCVACVVGVALSGCTSSQPSVLESATAVAQATSGQTSAPAATPSTTAPPAPVAPAAPSATPTEADAIAAGKYFLDLFHYAFATGDAAGLRAFSDPDCSYCNVVIGDVKDERTAGKREIGGEFEVTKARGTRVDPEFYTANFTLVQADSQVLDSDGHQVDESVGGTMTIDVALYFRGGQWSVAAVQAKRA